MQAGLYCISKEGLNGCTLLPSMRPSEMIGRLYAGVRNSLPHRYYVLLSTAGTNGALTLLLCVRNFRDVNFVV